MENNLNNSSNKEMSKSENVESPKRNRKWLLVVLLVAVLGTVCAGLFLSGINSKDESAKTEDYRFVNNNSALCTHDAEQNQIECINLQDNQRQTVTIPNEFKDLTSIQPSHDGTKLLLSLNSDPEVTKYIVTDTNFTNLQEVVVPYEDDNEANISAEIIWGSNSDKLLISQQVREENDANFLPAPLVVWEYNITSKENRRIYKNGDHEEPTNKLVGANDEFLFITQPVYKNWVAKDTDPPADALLAVRLDDGFVRIVNIEKLVKLEQRNKYASGISFAYDPILDTFYIGGQYQQSEGEYQNFYSSANLVESDGFELQKISTLTSQAQYYGITTSSGTLVVNWSEDEPEVFKHNLVASNREVYEIKVPGSDKNNSKFVIASLSDTD